MQTQAKQAAKPSDSPTDESEFISFQDFLKKYDGVHAEWHMGKVEIIRANNEKHQNIFMFLITLFNIYLSLKPVGKLLAASFTMFVGDDWPAREPDLMIVLNEHRERIKPTFLEGPADIAIEIVSPESEDRDYGKKFTQYEATGVREYWRIDPIREEVDMYALGEDNHYHRAAFNRNGHMVSAMLPDFALDPKLFWQEEMPNGIETVQLVQNMVGVQNS